MTWSRRISGWSPALGRDTQDTPRRLRLNPEAFRADHSMGSRSPRPGRLRQANRGDGLGENILETTETEPFNQSVLFRTVGLLVGASLMGVLYLARPHGSDYDLHLIIQAAALTTVTVIATVFLPWRRLPGLVRITPPLVFLAAAYLAMEATGGAASAYGQLVLLPIVWLAVYGTATELTTGLLGVTLALVAPVLIPGSDREQWRRTFLLIGSAAGVGFLVQMFFAQLREHTGRLSILALTDHLTGVANRRAWDEWMERAVDFVRGTGRPLCVVVLDVDDFKSFNDRFGHLAGDRFLKEITAKWQGQLRQSDLLARLGGDEFGVLLTSCTPEAAYGIVERLRRDMPSGWTCSAGIAPLHEGESAFELLGRADQALYRAKDSGRDRIVMDGADGPVESPRRDARADEGARLESV